MTGLGFSNGWDEFALKNPPPLVPSSLMASWEATGPPWRTWWPPAIVAIVCGSARFWMTPPAMRTTARTAAMGSSTRTVPRVRSTQKLPSRSLPVRARPRTRATATARPVAAERKFWTVSPAICTAYPVPDSPAYDCQFVFVVNETAVLNAVCQSIERPWLSGSHGCSTSSANSPTTETVARARTDRAYLDQRCSTSGSTPTAR